MKVLLIKMSSMGDVIHTLPALADVMQHKPQVRFHWVIEESFAELISAHPAVERVIPIAWRRWRRQLWRAWRSQEWHSFRKQLRAEEYDLIIDAQGLLKSAVVARLARGVRCGFARASAREPYSAYFYQRTFHVPWRQHAINRVRSLLAQSLGYPIPRDLPAAIPRTQPRAFGNSILFLHGTTWASKEWPESHWQQLAKRALAAGLQVKLPWSNTLEHERVLRLQAASA